jgi:lysophospholipase L1-like esterase
MATQKVPTLDGSGRIRDKHLPTNINAAAINAKAPVTTGRPGSRFVTLGDSITAGADDWTTRAQGVAWPHYLGLFSGQKATVVKNAGIPGNTTAEMLARFDADVTPYNPTAVTLLCGTNDMGQSRTFAAWSADVIAIVAKIRAIGAVPILATIPPNNNSVYRQTISQWNAWIRSYAAQQGLTVLPFYSLLVDPANGNYKSTYYSDGIHPSTSGQVAMGQLAADTIGPSLPVNAPPITSDDVDPNNNIALGCFTAGTGSTLPAGWTDGAGIPAGSVLSYITDAQVPGQMVKITQTGTAALRQLIYSQYLATTTLTNATTVGATSLVLPVRADYRGTLFIGSGSTFEVVKILSSSGAGPQTETLVSPLKYAHAAGEPVIANGAPGDELIFTGTITSDGGVTATVDTSLGGAAYSPAPMKGMAGAFTRARFYQRFTVPAGTTSMAARLQVGAGTGYVAFGQISVYNATRLQMVL